MCGAGAWAPHFVKHQNEFVLTNAIVVAIMKMTTLYQVTFTVKTNDRAEQHTEGTLRY